MVLDIIDDDDEDEGKQTGPEPMTRAKAEFMKVAIDRMEPDKKLAGAMMAIRINDKVAGTAEELPSDIADHFRGIIAGNAVADAHPLEIVDPPVNSRWGRR